MFRPRKPQRDLFSARNQYRDLLRPGSFYELLAEHGEQIFADHQFAGMYCDDNGRPCIPPSQMFILLLLSIHDQCSDYEAIERSRCDLRWLAALDLKIGQKLCGRSTLVEFRARVLLNEAHEEQFKANLALARRLGVLKGSHLEVALDTTPMLGRGALKDTYCLIADGIRKLASVLAALDQVGAEEWGKSHDLARYWGASSLKGDAQIDWSNAKERRVFLNSLVADAGRLLHLAECRAKTSKAEVAARIREATALLQRLISQDTEPSPDPDSPKSGKKAAKKKGAETEATPEARTSTEPTASPEAQAPNPATTAEPENQATSPEAAAQPEPAESNATEAQPSEGSANSGADASQIGVSVANSGPSSQEPGSHALSEMVSLRQGVAPNRVISVHDPEMRHGRKSASKLFHGNKTSVCVDTASKLILALDVIAGNAGDNQGALSLVRQAELNTGIPVERAVADCAYGDVATRQEFDDAGIELSAKVPSPPANEPFHRSRFSLDLTNRIAICPTGQQTSETDYAYHRDGTTERFLFPLSVCQSCPHKDQCLLEADKKRGRGRTLTLNPKEHLLERARQHQKSPEFRDDIKARQVVEHRQARMVQLGGRQSRYFGRKKSKYQAYMIALVANMTLMAGAITLFPPSAVVSGPLSAQAALTAQITLYTVRRPLLPWMALLRARASQTPGLRLAS